MRCHQAESKVWRESKHASALKTLQSDGHDKDPDCVGCHVVGLDKVKGFESREKTPTLADVGCESCHGAGRIHAMRPRKNNAPIASVEVCTTCHNPQHSPEFDFEKYWANIAH